MKLIDVKTPTNLEEEGGRGVGPLQKDGLDPPMVIAMLRICDVSVAYGSSSQINKINISVVVIPCLHVADVVGVVVVSPNYKHYTCYVHISVNTIMKYE